MPVKSIAECSKGSILQYFRPSLIHYSSLRSLFCLFFSGLFYTGFRVCLVFYQDSVFNMRKTAIHVKRPTVSLKIGCYVLLQYYINFDNFYSFCSVFLFIVIQCTYFRCISLKNILISQECFPCPLPNALYQNCTKGSAWPTKMANRAKNRNNL